LKNLTITNQFEAPAKRQPKWNLTETAFDKLLSCLAEDDGSSSACDRERAGERYLLLRRNLVRFFEGRAVGGEAEEAADEVCNRLARKLEAGERFENINQFAYGVARLLALELYKTRARAERALNDLPTQETATPDEEEDENKFQLERLTRCLSELPEESRALILTYYSGDGRKKIENRRQLAEKLGIPQNALRSRAVRLRDKLKILVAGNLKDQPT
jgi:RNA polymerase sigma factor (sigma-70 family)